MPGVADALEKRSARQAIASMIFFDTCASKPRIQTFRSREYWQQVETNIFFGCAEAGQK
ncbi:MAG: hypothetical protein ACI83P_000828 [Janthinobacterium sp.]|jgi:hypothetical protein